jgi:hypothetical protein
MSKFFYPAFHSGTVCLPLLGNWKCKKITQISSDNVLESQPEMTYEKWAPRMVEDTIQINFTMANYRPGVQTLIIPDLEKNQIKPTFQNRVLLQSVLKGIAYQDEEKYKLKKSSKHHQVLVVIVEKCLDLV